MWYHKSYFLDMLYCFVFQSLVSLFSQDPFLAASGRGGRMIRSGRSDPRAAAQPADPARRGPRHQLRLPRPCADPKSRLSILNFCARLIILLLSLIFSWNSLISGNYLDFPAIPTKLCENLGEKKN